MPTVRVRIMERRPNARGRQSVHYCDPANPNHRYEVEAPSASLTDVANAIAAHIEARRAAGLDYPGEPTIATEEIDVITS